MSFYYNRKFLLNYSKLLSIKILLLIIILSLSLSSSSLTSNETDLKSIIVARFPKSISNNPDENFYHQLLDGDHTIKKLNLNHLSINISVIPTVFLSANNYIFQLDLDLNPLKNLSLIEYLKNCNENSQQQQQQQQHKCSEFKFKNEDDYIVQSLVIDWLHRWLIACGTWNSGECLITDLNNITNVLYWTQESIVSNDKDSSTVAFIAPGPSTLVSSIKQYDSQMVLYVASKHNKYRSEIIASRSLNLETLMSLAYSDVSSGTRLNIKSDIVNNFYLRYVYGFESNNYSFFLLVRSKNHENNQQQLITKLVRVCQNDSRYYSYTEVPIKCLSTGSGSFSFENNEDEDDDEDNNQAYAAYLLRSNTNTSHHLKSFQNYDYLFILFKKSDQSSSSKSSSSICIYPMWQIQEQFDKNIAKCFAGEGMQNIAYIHTTLTTCAKTGMTPKDYACGSDVNQQLDTKDPIYSNSIIETKSFQNTDDDDDDDDDPIVLTSILANWINNNMVVFTGNSIGQLNKYLIKYIPAEQQTTANLNYSPSSLFKAKLYDQLDLNIEEILPDMFLINDNLYLMTSNEVMKIKIQQCNQYRTCNECLSSMDPFCGWCLSENKCSLINECDELLNWIHKSFDDYTDNIQCAMITNVQPSSIAIRTRKLIQIQVKDLRLPYTKNPQEALELYCVFHFNTIETDKKISTNLMMKSKSIEKQKNKHISLVNCPSPDVEQLPKILSGEHSLHSKLALAFGKSNKTLEKYFKIDEIQFHFFDCSSYNSCVGCVKADFQCGWCTKEQKCKDRESSCKMDKQLSPKNRNDKSTSLYCPQIAPINKTTKILIHEKLSTQIQVHFLNLNDIELENKSIECRFKLSPMAKDIITSGQLRNENQTILCQKIRLTAEQPFWNNFTERLVPLEIKVNKYLLDNPYNIHLVMYRCWAMAQTCDECLSLPNEYDCGWCVKKQEKTEIKQLTQSSSCQVSKRCSLKTFSAWLDPTVDQICPEPKIFDFNPKFGPVQGGTELTIDGTNLGRHLHQLNVSIIISKNQTITCKVMNLDRGKQLKCLLEENKSVGKAKHNQGGPIKIVIGEHYHTQTYQWYSFVEPQVSDLYPKIGPKSGGTIVTISGQYLNCGSELKVLFGQSQCKITFENSTNIQCLTPSWKSTIPNYTVNQLNQTITKFDKSTTTTAAAQVNVTVFIDKAEIKLKQKFKYFDDPKIDQIKMDDQNNSDDIFGIPSGGIQFLVYGQRLDIIQKPKFYLKIHNKKSSNKSNQSSMFISDCYTKNSSVMICETPKVPEDILENSYNVNFTLMDFGFILDDCDDRRFSSNIPNTFRMYRQPKFEKFKEKDHINHVSDREYLTINGENLDLLDKFKDQIKIWIGESKSSNDLIENSTSQTKNICKIILNSYNQLTCRLPFIEAKQQQCNGNYSDQCRNQCQWKVQISIGNGVNALQQSIGYVDYCKKVETNPLYSILIIAAGIILLLIIIVALLTIYYKCRTSEHRKKLQGNRAEFEKLEMAINEEAREAFTELQLSERSNQDVIANDFGHNCHLFETYALNALLNNKEERENFVMEAFANSGLDLMLKKFRLLILDEKFLLLFIQTLDKDKNFSMKDQVLFGSYLVLALIDQMTYLTRIIFILLKKKIDDNRKEKAGSNALKLLLRRNDSIVERLVSTWLNLLLYEYFLETDLPLYLYRLYLAIKLHCYKDPVDQITKYARNTLSEDTILRIKLQYEQIKIIVSIFDESHIKNNNKNHLTKKLKFKSNQSSISNNNSSINNSSTLSEYFEPEHIYEELTNTTNSETPIYQEIYFQENSSKKLNDYQVTVLNCDTIEQVIKKSLDIIYKSIPFSKRLYSCDQLDLESLNPQKHLNQRILSNKDSTTESVRNGHVIWTRLNIVQHYKIENGDKFRLIPKDFREKIKEMKTTFFNSSIQTALTTTASTTSLSTFFPNKQISIKNPLQSLPMRSRTKSMVNSNFAQQRKESVHCPTIYKDWHLMQQSSELNTTSKSNEHLVMSPEIFTNRRLSTKNFIQPYVDNLFRLILNSKQNQNQNQNNNYSNLNIKPIESISSNGYSKLISNKLYHLNDSISFVDCKPIKYLFDFFDQQAYLLINNNNDDNNNTKQIEDLIVVEQQKSINQLGHIWKTNCLPLRVWANILNNPEFLLDVESDPVIKNNLMIVMQIFMDSCSLNPPEISKKSSSSKLLYAKDFQRYNQWVHEYYQQIQQSKTISDNEMKLFLDDFSKLHSSKINQLIIENALIKVFKFCLRNRRSIIQSIIQTNDQQLLRKFEQLFK